MLLHEQVDVVVAARGAVVEQQQALTRALSASSTAYSTGGGDRKGGCPRDQAAEGGKRSGVTGAQEGPPAAGDPSECETAYWTVIGWIIPSSTCDFPLLSTKQRAR